MYLVIANFGNDSIALIQHLIEQGNQEVTVLSVDTGWQAPWWQERVMQAKQWVNEQGFAWQRLTAERSFQQLVEERKQFPSKKFQWCATFLKGVPINAYLDANDPLVEFDIVLAKRRNASRANQQLSEWIEESPHYGERRVWHPLLSVTDEEYQRLLTASGFTQLQHRSFECEACIHAKPLEREQFSQQTKQRLQQLEHLCQAKLYPKLCDDQADGVNYHESFNMGCGSPWGCGE